MTALEIGLLTLAVTFVTLTALRLLFVPLSLAHEWRDWRRRRKGLTGPLARTPSVSVVVPAYNEEKVLVPCVRSILASGYPDLEVIIVDDGSKDSTPHLMRDLAAEDARVRAIHQPNAGKGAALNTGFAAARGEFLLFVDADGVFTHDTIPEMLRAFADPQVGAVCGDDRPVNLDRIQTRFLALVAHVGTGLVRRAMDILGCVPVVSGNSGAFRRSALTELSVPRRRARRGHRPAPTGGPLRTDTVGEDLEMTWRLHRGGWTVAFAPRAVVLAESPSSLLSLWKQRTRWARGLLQSLRLHADAVGSLRYQAFGPFLLYTIITMVLIPLIQIASAVVVVVLWPVAALTGTQVEFTEPFAVWGWLVTGGLVMALLLVVFSALLDRAPGDLRHLWAVLLWPFFSAFLALTMLRALWLEVRRRPSAWNKLERTGVNSYAATTPGQVAAKVGS